MIRRLGKRGWEVARHTPRAEIRRLPLAPPMSWLRGEHCLASLETKPSRFGRWVCNRRRGHTGRHAAYGVHNVLAVWEDPDA